MFEFFTYNKKENSNVFISILYSLGVKHTVYHSNKAYNEHPNKYNLLGLSQMLYDYSIENAGIRIDNKEKELSELEAPFIAHAGGDFVTVNKLTSDTNILISIFTNPHCDPCSRMHTRVEKLLENTGEKVCIQYIFPSFLEELESRSDFLIRSYLTNERKQSMTLSKDWFQYGKQNKNNYFAKYAYVPNSSCKELLQHKKWKELTKLSATPTVLVNEHKLPDNYKIEGLKNFQNLMLAFNNHAKLQGMGNNFAAWCNNSAETIKYIQNEKIK